MNTELSHRAVLVQEVVQALRIRPEGAYVDATFGRGGHSAAILAALGARGRLLALDRDPAAERFAEVHFQGDVRFSFRRTPFAHLADMVAQEGLAGRVLGVLLDIGVSSPQLDSSERGFSFAKDGPLDMRMDPDAGSSASQWLAGAAEDEISRVIRDFGEERFHRRIAGAIVRARRDQPIETTLRLAKIIEACVPTRERGKHPATRSFQAIRIFINGELEQLQAALAQALDVLSPEGRLVVISFHSLEDRIVKRFMRRQARGLELPLDLPVPVSRSGAKLRVVSKALRPDPQETLANPRARSAVMRVAERLP
jgi:16S rRNA (cytosine1402-N4)-methyltransferase